MSEFGAYLLVFGVVMALIGAVKFFSWLTEALSSPSLGGLADSARHFADQRRDRTPVHIRHTPARYPPRLGVVKDYEEGDVEDEGYGEDEEDSTHARASAKDQNTRAPDSTAVRASAESAGVREGVPIVAFRTHHEQQAARRMVRHKIDNPKADMLDTIRAGFPEIKSRSGDPKSKYQLYGKPMYDALFAEVEPEYPALEAQRRASVVDA